jgi:hypothetical protein
MHKAINKLYLEPIVYNAFNTAKDIKIMRRTADNSGFQTSLRNGLTVSVQWHDGALAKVTRDTGSDGVQSKFRAADPTWDEIKQVEIACWDTRTKLWMTREVWGTDDDVIPYVKRIDILQYINTALFWEKKNVPVTD